MSYAVEPSTLAALTIWQEARGEPFAGQVAVAQVIRNRMARKYSSDGTVSGTVLSPYQFSGWNTEDPGRVLSLKVTLEDQAFQSCKIAWEKSGEFLGLLFPAVLFHSRGMDSFPTWAHSEKVKQIAVIGNHIFYDEVK